MKKDQLTIETVVNALINLGIEFWYDGQGWSLSRNLEKTPTGNAWVLWLLDELEERKEEGREYLNSFCTSYEKARAHGIRIAVPQ